ncbi:MAG: N-acetylmuramoyl-L-alanine amidase [Candidatus Hydrogenedentes bacterium]|nr:N-acetylmuramoyl-L-alanine amidase [Candidatus Hydrogenedentota bacterium]
MGVGNVVKIRGRTVVAAGAFLLILLSIAGTSAAVEVIRRALEPGVFAMSRDGRAVGIEVRALGGDAARRVLSKYLAIESEWVAYRGRVGAFIPLSHLKSEHRRTVLLTIFTGDIVDDRGWLHTAIADEETLWSICTWIVGDGKAYKQVINHSENAGVETTLRAGQRVLIPRSLLNGAMARHTPVRILEPEPVRILELEPEMATLHDGLRYGSDGRGEYALYTLKNGESLYSSVVARFTDIQNNEDILDACDLIANRSGIPDMQDIDAGKKIYIPLEFLSDRYLPEGNPVRKRYEAALIEAERLRGGQGVSKDLSDVVVILDPGHGGSDTGATHIGSGLYEDEINYDIVCRIRDLLRKNTGAKVYVTMVDRSSGYAVTNKTRFSYDRDEELLTTPRHLNADGANVSANLRWMLVNSIYDKERKRGIDSRKIIFTSIHTDSLYNAQLRGAMIYIPGAKYRRSEEVRLDPLYAKYQEGRNYNRFTSSTSERRLDEALSRNFATTLLDELGKKRVKRHDNADPIRSKIRRSRTSVFVPAVLRNTKVPTKVLLETANLKNATDRKRLADPWWRQQVAIAYVDALKRYYGSGVPTKVAQTD